MIFCLFTCRIRGERAFDGDVIQQLHGDDIHGFGSHIVLLFGFFQFYFERHRPSTSWTGFPAHLIISQSSTSFSPIPAPVTTFWQKTSSSSLHRNNNNNTNDDDEEPKKPVQRRTDSTTEIRVTAAIIEAEAFISCTDPKYLALLGENFGTLR